LTRDYVAACESQPKNSNFYERRRYLKKDNGFEGLQVLYLSWPLLLHSSPSLAALLLLAHRLHCRLALRSSHPLYRLHRAAQGIHGHSAQDHSVSAEVVGEDRQHGAVLPLQELLRIGGGGEGVRRLLIGGLDVTGLLIGRDLDVTRWLIGGDLDVRIVGIGQ